MSGRWAVPVGLLAICGVAWASPADLAPGAPELLAAEQRLLALSATAQAVGEATSRLQAAWTLLPLPTNACGEPRPPAPDASGAPSPTDRPSDQGTTPPGPDEAPPPVPEDPAQVRLEIGWRIERFGSAWRDAIQAVRAQAERVRRYRSSATVAPLVDARWTAALDRALADADRDQRALLEASAWQVLYVRPVLAACAAITPRPRPGISMLTTPTRGELDRSAAILALGDGWVCGSPDQPGERADDAVVLVPRRACWSASPTCGCALEPVEPGAILGPPVTRAE